MDKSLYSPKSSFLAQFVLCFSISLFTAILIEVGSGRARYWVGIWPSYTHLLLNLHEPMGRLRWFLGDISEITFYKHELPALGLLAGAWLAHWAQRHGRCWQGFSMCYASSLWPWLVTSSLLGLLLSHLFWGWTLNAGAWQPTFVAFVSVPAAWVLMYGKGWKVALTGALLGPLLVTPASLLLVNYVCVPLALPPAIGSVTGMALAGVVAFTLNRKFSKVRHSQPNVITVAKEHAQTGGYGLVWILRRVLADFSEAFFLGNELASFGLLSGALAAYALTPASPAYGSVLLPEIIIGQALASLIGVLVWRRHWMSHGWYPTYIPVVSIVPVAILTLGGSWPVVALSAGLGALIGPPLACAINLRLPTYLPSYIGCMLAMALSTLVLVPLVGVLTKYLPA
ncbi:hypothetical protein G7009_05600 [Pseudomonas capeferrum]|uniref:hypothetical protein n=1 Tax=Pseudomonas capeferrum TaxID=1495066 RepID=UPI0015E46A38|nr:hypothetical protein [Pseudomonas capeferrum]MBA1201244.1 hypothetical protein [Pseudomonas capeferrum]